MWSVEELSIQHQTQKVTVLNVKKYASPAGRTDGLGLLYMGYQSLFCGRKFRPSIMQSAQETDAENEIDDDPPQTSQYLTSENITFSPNLDTILDTGGIKLLKANTNTNMSDNQVQTDLSMPVWVLNGMGRSVPNAEVDEGSNHNAKKITSRGLQWQSRMDYPNVAPIDVNSCQQFSVVHYQHVGKSSEKSMMMVQTHNKNQTSLSMFDVSERHSEPLQLEDGSGDASRYFKKDKLKDQKKSKPVRICNRHAYTCQYESLSEYSELSPVSSDTTNSGLTSPDDAESEDQGNSSSTDLLTSSDDCSSGNVYPGVIPSQSIDSDMVSLISTPSEESYEVLTIDAESSMWDKIQLGKVCDVIPEENIAVENGRDVVVSDAKSVSLVDEIKELSIDSVNFPLNSTNDKPAISYKAYKVDSDTNQVVLSKGKIATYLPMMAVRENAIEDSFEQNEIENQDTLDALNAVDSNVLSSFDGRETKKGELNDSLSPAKTYTSTSYFASQTNEKRVSLENTFGLCNKSESEHLNMASNVPVNREAAAPISQNTNSEMTDKSDSFHSPSIYDESVTVYLKTGGTKTVKQSSESSHGTVYHRTTAEGEITPRSESAVTKAFGSSRQAAVQGLNQFQTVISRTPLRKKTEKHCQELGLNLLSSSPVTVKRKPAQLQVSLLSPGGSTTSDDDGNQHHMSGSRKSTESDIASGAYLMASYDDGSDWGDDSLLWNTDSMDSLTSHMSDGHTHTTLHCEVHPHWMEELPTRLHTVPLTGLVIPDFASSTRGRVSRTPPTM